MNASELAAPLNTRSKSSAPSDGGARRAIARNHSFSHAPKASQLIASQNTGPATFAGTSMKAGSRTTPSASRATSLQKAEKASCTSLNALAS